MSEETDRQAPNGPVLPTPLSAGEFQLLFNEAFLLGTVNWGPRSGFMVRRQADVLLSKYPHMDDFGLPRVDTRSVALEAFNRAEDRCRLVNQTVVAATACLQADSPLKRVLRLASLQFQGILRASFNPEGLAFNFGPGSTSSLRFTEANALAKCAHTGAEVTPALREHLGTFKSLLPHLSFDGLKTVDGGVLSFVPKNSKTDRTILLEPDLNVLAQKGIGSALRQGIRAYCGMDLDNQADVARAMLLSDRALSLATEDLTMASDTIASSTVRLLGTLFGPLDQGPATMLACMEASRSTMYRTSRKAGKGRPFEKWSSMGNAYTFEMETAIFWSLSYAASVMSGVFPDSTNLSVFGDDIIVRCSVVPLLREALQHLGFTSNEEKSFSSGPFRESCGLEVYDTRNVSPFRIKGRIATHGQVYWLANTFRSWYNRLYEVATEEGVDPPSALPLWTWVWRHIPRGQLLRGPDTLDGKSVAGDGHLHVGPDYLPKGRRPSHGHEGRLYQTWVSIPSSVAFDEVPTSYALLEAERSVGGSLSAVSEKALERLLTLGEPRRRISRYTPPSPEEDGAFNGQIYSTSCLTRGDGGTRRATVKQFATALPRGKF